MFYQGAWPAPGVDARVPPSASLLWSQRHNPAWLPVATFVAAFHRSEAHVAAWESADGRWVAELRRARRGDHVYLALWRDGLLLGTYDGRRGWRSTTERASALRRRPTAARQLALAS